MYIHADMCVFFLGNCKDYKFSKEKQSEFRFIYHWIEIAPLKKLVRGLGGLS